MLQGISLGRNILAEYEVPNSVGFISEMTQINILVGGNNSGKSRLLRKLFEDVDTKYIFTNSQTEFEQVESLIDNCIFELDKMNRLGIEFTEMTTLIKIRSEIGKKNLLNSALILLKLLEDINESKFILNSKRWSNQLRSFLGRLDSKINDLKTIIGRFGETKRTDKIYIPILRGLRPISFKNKLFDNQDIYYERTVNDYFSIRNLQGKIFTGLTVYEDVKRLLLGVEHERNEIKAFERFLKENIFKKGVTLIPKYDEDVLHIKIEGQNQHPIYNLGDGLQTLIIILFPIFINRKKNCLIFIEEPETHLHPKWQRLLARSMSLFENNTYLVSTHSSVFINLKQSSIFNISKSFSKTKIENANLVDNKIKILRKLGYKPNDLFQTNYIIWVEGPSDKTYINYFIKKFDGKLVEGEDYSIMYYSGSTYKHILKPYGKLDLGFLKTLNQNNAIIMDSDKTSIDQNITPEKKEILELCSDNEAFCWITNKREIENYIPFEEFKNAVIEVHKTPNIEIKESDYDDRCKYVNLDKDPNYKPKIKLTDKLFSIVQKNNNGTLKGASEKIIREELKKSLDETISKIDTIDKPKVAEKCVKNEFEIVENEAISKIKELIKDIKEANN